MKNLDGDDPVVEQAPSAAEQSAEQGVVREVADHRADGGVYKAEQMLVAVGENKGALGKTTQSLNAEFDVFPADGVLPNDDEEHHNSTDDGEG